MKATPWDDPHIVHDRYGRALTKARNATNGVEILGFVVWMVLQAFACFLSHGSEQERWNFVTETVYIHLSSRDVLSPKMLYYILNIFRWNGRNNPESSAQAHHRMAQAEIDWDFFDRWPTIPTAPPIPVAAGIPNTIIDPLPPLTRIPLRRQPILAEQQAARFDVRIFGPNNDVQVAFAARGNDDGTTRKSKRPRT